MGTMHRELIEKRKATTIISLIIILCAMLFLSTAIGEIKISRYYKLNIITDPVITFLTIVFFIFEIFKCKIKYKYSIIADKLMIHKVFLNDEKILEKIRLSDIVYVGKDVKWKKHFNISDTKKYICNLVTDKTYCCIYKLNGEYKKVYFQPSSELIRKINNFHVRYTNAI